MSSNVGPDGSDRDPNTNPVGTAHYEYFEALGRLIHEFAQVEAVGQSLLFYYAGVPDIVGKALFSGVRLDSAKDPINRIIDAVELPPQKKANLKFAFDQLGKISSKRNNIMHFGAVYDGERGFVVSNSRSAHIETKINEFAVKASDLNDMISDLETAKQLSAL